MRRCPKCLVVYHSARRLTCLYCDSRLMPAGLDEIFQARENTFVKMKESFLTEPMNLERMQYLLGSYFQIRSFIFTYGFCRNELRMGKEFKRFFIEPLGFSSLIKLPWLLIDLVDSMFFHLFYRSYCPQCGWKFMNLSSEAKHSPEECEYSKEYSALMNEILSGDIVQNEERFERRALFKVRTGQRSPYYDLCSRKKQLELFLDLIVILLSMSLIMFVLVRVAMIYMGKIYHF